MIRGGLSSSFIFSPCTISNVQKRFFSRYHSALEIPITANQEQIRQSYLKLARKWHPDMFTNKSQMEYDEAQRRYRNIREAYDYLSQRAAETSAATQGRAAPKNPTSRHGDGKYAYDAEYSRQSGISHVRLVERIFPLFLALAAFSVFLIQVKQYEKARDSRVTDEDIANAKKPDVMRSPEASKRLSMDAKIRDDMTKSEYESYKEAQRFKVLSLSKYVTEGADHNATTLHGKPLTGGLQREMKPITSEIHRTRLKLLNRVREAEAIKFVQDVRTYSKDSGERKKARKSRKKKREAQIASLQTELNETKSLIAQLQKQLEEAQSLNRSLQAQLAGS